jgi:lysophospholipase L1-like esterase
MKTFFTNAFLIIISTFFALIICEFVLRIISPFDTFSKSYPLSLNLNELSTSQPNKFDINLGYKFKESYYHSSHPNFGNSLFTTYSDGTRSNLYEDEDFFIESNFEQPIFNKNRAIVVTGDSFVAGNQVANNHTWPAYLEKKLGYRVINGGVGGYSTLQAILHGEELIVDKKIKHLIVSLIPEDLVRAEHSIYQGVPRPYFKKMNNDGYVIEKKHIKKYENFTTEDKTYMDKILKNKSFLLMEIFKRTARNEDVFYYYGLQKKEDLRFDKVGCLLVDYLNDFKRKSDIKIALLIEYPAYYFNSHVGESKGQKYIKKYFNNFVNCVSESELLLIDLYEPMVKQLNKDENKFNSLYISRAGHMSPKGNNFVAKKIHNILKKEWYK